MREVSRTKRRSFKTRAGSRALRARAARRIPARRGPRSAHRLPPRLNRRNEQTRRVGASRRRSRRPRLALLRRAREGRTAPRCAITAGSPRRLWAASPRAKTRGPARVALLHSFVVTRRLVASTVGAATLQLVPASVAPRRPFRRLRAPGTPARKTTPFALLTARRCAPCAYASRSAFRS